MESFCVEYFRAGFFGIENFFARFFRPQNFLSQEFLAVKFFMPEIFIIKIFYGRFFSGREIFCRIFLFRFIFGISDFCRLTHAKDIFPVLQIQTPDLWKTHLAARDRRVWLVPRQNEGDGNSSQVAASSFFFRAGRRLTDVFTSRAACWVRICCRLSSALVSSRRSPSRWISKIRFRSRSADSR